MPRTKEPAGVSFWRSILIWLVVANILGCSRDSPNGKPLGQQDRTELFVYSDELVFPSLHIVDVTDSVLETNNAKDLKGQLSFSALKSSVGVALPDGTLHPLFPAGTSVPVERTQELSTADDWQTELDISLYDGEDRLASNNHSIGNVRITGIAPAKAGISKIVIKLAVEANGKLRLSALDATTGHRFGLKQIDH